MQDAYPGQIALLHAQKGLHLAQQGDDKGAVAEFETAFSHDPDVGPELGVHFAAADCYSRLGKLKRGLELAKKEVALGGAQSETAKMLAKLLERRIRKAAAETP